MFDNVFVFDLSIKAHHKELEDEIAMEAGHFSAETWIRSVGQTASKQDAAVGFLQID